MHEYGSTMIQKSLQVFYVASPFLCRLDLSCPWRSCHSQKQRSLCNLRGDDWGDVIVMLFVDVCRMITFISNQVQSHRWRWCKVFGFSNGTTGAVLTLQRIRLFCVPENFILQTLTLQDICTRSPPFSVRFRFPASLFFDLYEVGNHEN